MSVFHQRRPGRPSAASAAASSGPTVTRGPVPDLPDYEAPTHVLDRTAQDSLSKLLSASETRKLLEHHLPKTMEMLTRSVAGVTDRLVARRVAVETRAKKRAAARAEGEDEMTAEEVRKQEEEEAYLAKLDEKVSLLTTQSEAAVREMIDCRAEIQDEKEALNKVKAQVSAQQPRVRPEKPQRSRVRPGRDDDDSDHEDDENEEQADQDDGDDVEEPYVGASEMMKAARQEKSIEYKALSVHSRYAKDNAYISLKQAWHDAVHLDDGVLLPHASKWFDEHGRPVVPTAEVAGEDDDDEELVVRGEKKDTKCPLSLVTMTNPYQSTVCHHTFEQAAILEFLRNGPAKCPKVGCDKTINQNDLVLDEVMLRAIKRAEKAAQQASDDDESDAGSDEADETQASVVAGRSSQVKKERFNARRRLAEGVEEADD